MSKEILIHAAAGERRVVILNNGKLDDFYLEVDRSQSILGNIYKGKVESILPSINGAFVNIGQERNGFLYLTDAVNPLIANEIDAPKGLLNRIFNNNKKPPNSKNNDRRKYKNEPMSLKEGQEILVQVVKDPFGNKGARLTTHITLAGRFIVYMPYDKHYGVSKKIEGVEERKRLREVINSFNFAKTGGFIVRTVSASQNKNDLTRDAKFLTKIWRQILKLSEQKQAPSLIYKEFDLLWKVVRDFFREDVKSIVINSRDEYLKLRKFVQTLVGREAVGKVQLYKGRAPIFDAKNVSRELDKIFETKVHLKSGAHIVIEPTEGLIVVDVNSGKFRTKASPEEAACMVNLDAAREIARQLRFRDLGGIIVIDFIDMNREDNRRKVLNTLQDALAEDYAKTEVYKISPLGLVEMTRARTGRTIEAVSFKTCPYCTGRGNVRIS